MHFLLLVNILINALEMLFVDIYYSVDFGLVMYFLKGPRFHMPADGVNI